MLGVECSRHHVTLRFIQATVESITQNFDALNLHNDVIDVGKRKRDLCEDELKSAREQLEAGRALYQQLDI